MTQFLIAELTNVVLLVFPVSQRVWYLWGVRRAIWQVLWCKYSKSTYLLQHWRISGMHASQCYLQSANFLTLVTQKSVQWYMHEIDRWHNTAVQRHWACIVDQQLIASTCNPLCIMCLLITWSTVSIEVIMIHDNWQLYVSYYGWCSLRTCNWPQKRKKSSV